jgi:hypothetical protein
VFEVNDVWFVRRDISGVIDEINRLQAVWLSRQSELVALDKRSEREEERTNELRTKHAIFCDRQYRLNADVEARQGEVVKQVCVMCWWQRPNSVVILFEWQERLYKQLQNELLKLNTLVTRNRGIQSELQQAQELLQNDFVLQLKVALSPARPCTSILPMFKVELRFFLGGRKGHCCNAKSAASK